MANILQIPVSGLAVAQRSLMTTTHNIVNVNTDGYSRQRVVNEAREPSGFGGGFLGTGVTTQSVTRAYDEFLVTNVRSNTSIYEETKNYQEFSGRIDNLLSGSNLGLMTSMQGFFDSVDEVANNPSSLPSRTVMMTEANSLVDRINEMDGSLRDLQTELSNRVKNEIGEINNLAKFIGQLNGEVAAVAAAGDQAPNDLLDKRDILLKQLSEKVGVKVIDASNGEVSVFVGKGQSLVTGTAVSKLAVLRDEEDFAKFNIGLVSDSGISDVSKNIDGGGIRGLLNFQDDVLDKSRNSIGRIATVLAKTFNDQHKLGADLNGNLGGDFFNEGTVVVAENSTNTGTGVVTAAFGDVSNLTTSDYRLVYDGSDSYTLTKLSDKTQTTINTGGASPFAATEMDGVALTITGGAAVGDAFLIRPTFGGGSEIGLKLTQSSGVAAGSPVTTSQAVDATGRLTNTGSGDIGEPTVTDVTNLPLGADITLTFSSATNQLTMVPDPNGDSPLAYDPATESGKSFTVLGGVAFTMSGTPADGDSFVLGNNDSGGGDNTNALILSKIRSDAIMDGGDSTIQSAYSELVSEMGGLSKQALNDLEARTSILEISQQSLDSKSGVNLDEEAANLLIFQQAYQASARAISIASSLFDTLIQSVR